jgi:hypothetical protein
MRKNTLNKYGDPTDPNRGCADCGSVGNNMKNGRTEVTRYLTVCYPCYINRIKSKKFNKCQTCFEDKPENYTRECGKCYQARYYSERVVIPGEDLLKIKKWVEKQIRFNFMTNMTGINELITNYQLICKSIWDLDHLKTPKQLKSMWDSIWKMYNDELKDIPDNILLTMQSNRVTKEIINKNKILNIMTNDDFKKIDILLEHTESIEIDGKFYNLKNEYNLCTMGNKTACRRFRKMLAVLNIDIKDLRVSSLKYANK